MTAKHRLFFIITFLLIFLDVSVAARERRSARRREKRSSSAAKSSSGRRSQKSRSSDPMASVRGTSTIVEEDDDVEEVVADPDEDPVTDEPGPEDDGEDPVPEEPGTVDDDVEEIVADPDEDPSKDEPESDDDGDDPVPEEPGPADDDDDDDSDDTSARKTVVLNPGSTKGDAAADAAVGGLDINGNPSTANSENAAVKPVLNAKGEEVLFERQVLRSIGGLPRRCSCSSEKSVDVSDLRSLSDKFMSGGSKSNSLGFSNMLWSWGQFIDHDVVGTIEDMRGPSYTVPVSQGGRSGKMVVHRLIAPSRVGCPSPKNVHTAAIDGGPIYGTDKDYLKDVLREPGSCRLRTSASDMLPITTVADGKGRFFFVAGDVRVDEHALLTSMHTVWMREHNRICDSISKSGGSPDEQFELTRQVVMGKMQQITMTEFLPALGITQADLRAAPNLKNNRFVTIEFATVAYRFGHDLVPSSMGSFSTASIFNGQEFFLQKSGNGYAVRGDANSKLDSLLTAAANSRCAERDGEISDTLRNTLFGRFGHDLAARNIFRRRDMAMPSYKALAECYGATPDAEVVSQGIDEPFIALLKENPGQMLGDTAKKIIATEFKSIFFGKYGSWWETNPRVSRFASEIRSATLGKVISANSGANVGANAFRA